MLPSRKITPKPATTVVEETALGQEPSVGSSIDYARADHTHGTPSNLGRVYYLVYSENSDIGGYKTASLEEPTGTETSLSQANTGTGDTLVASFATAAGDTGITLLPMGQAFRHFHVGTGAANQVGRLKVELYKRTHPGGVETLLRSGYSQNFNDAQGQELEWGQFFETGHALDPTDRVVFKLYTARVSGPATCDVKVYFEGTTRISYITTSILSSGAGSTVSPGNTVVEEIDFGQTSDPGVSAEYSRADHTHGTPENPVPDHEAALDPHPQYVIDNVSAASRLIGRGSGAGAGAQQEIILGSGLSMSGTTLNATGGGGAANGYFPAGW